MILLIPVNAALRQRLLTKEFVDLFLSNEREGLRTDEQLAAGDVTLREESLSLRDDGPLDFELRVPVLGELFELTAQFLFVKLI